MLSADVATRFAGATMATMHGGCSHLTSTNVRQRNREKSHKDISCSKGRRSLPGMDPEEHDFFYIYNYVFRQRDFSRIGRLPQQPVRGMQTTFNF